MGKVVSVHEYELKSGAERRGLFDLPGLSEHHFLRRLKDGRHGRYAAVWIFDGREAWERLWGHRTRHAPIAVSSDVAGRGERDPGALLAQDPDTIRFTSYEEVGTGY